VAPDASVANDAYGVQALAQSFSQTATKLGCDSLIIGLEATSLYSWHLAWVLSSHQLLKDLNPQVYLLNPKLIAKFKKAMATDGGKDDSVDALAILDRLRLGRLPHPFTPDDRYLPLQRLTRYRYHLVTQVVREKNYFLSYLFLKCSGLVQQPPFSNHFGAASTAVITEFFSVEEIAAQSVDELARFIAEKSRNHFEDPGRLAKELKRAAQNSYRLPDKLKQPVNAILASSLARIRFVEKQIKAVDKQIERELTAVSNPLLSVPGLGPVFTAGIIAEIGDISRFATEAALAKYAGLTWRRNQSSEFEGEDRPLTKTGNHYLRYYLVEGANSMRVHNAEYQAYYQKKYREATRHHHRRAVVLTARKLVRLVHALLRKNRLYKPRKGR
jgi:transposase